MYILDFFLKIDRMMPCYNFFIQWPSYEGMLSMNACESTSSQLCLKAYVMSVCVSSVWRQGPV